MTSADHSWGSTGLGGTKQHEADRLEFPIPFFFKQTAARGHAQVGRAWHRVKNRVQGHP